MTPPDAPPAVAAPPAAASLLRRLLPWVGRGLVLVVLGVWLARFADRRALLDALASVPLPELLGATGLAVLNMTLGGIRWWVLMRAFGGRELPPLPEVVRLFFVGLFYNTFIPGSVGGDVVRGALTRRCFDQPAAGFLVVLLERLIGFSTLGLVFLVGATVRPWPFDVRTVLPWVGALLVLGVVLVALALLSGKLAAMWRQVPPLRRPTSLVTIFAISLAGHTLSVATVWLLAHGMGLTPTLADLLFAVPLALIAALVPISLLGMGPREATLVGLLVRLGTAAEPAAVLALGYAAVNLSLAALGGLVQLAGPRRTKKQA